MGLGWYLTSRLGTLFTSPNENELIHEICKHEHWKHLQHILKFHTRTNCSVKIFKCLRKKIFHSNSNFHFGLVNISSKHSSIPFQNNWRWEITQHTINTENQQLFWSKRWWMYMWMCWTAFDRSYEPQGHI